MENIREYLQELLNKWNGYETYGGSEAISFLNDIEMLLECWDERIADDKKELETTFTSTSSTSFGKGEIRETKQEVNIKSVTVLGEEYWLADDVREILKHHRITLSKLKDNK